MRRGNDPPPPVQMQYYALLFIHTDNRIQRRWEKGLREKKVINKSRGCGKQREIKKKKNRISSRGLANWDAGKALQGI